MGKVNPRQNTKRLKTAFKSKLGGYAKMNANQIIRHLEDLKKEAEGHFTDDGDDEIFHQDAKALKAAIDAVLLNETVIKAIKGAIKICTRDIRNAEDDSMKAMERRINLSNQKMKLEALLGIAGGEEDD